MHRCLVLGGYGAFGSRIATRLARSDSNVSVTIIGRNGNSAKRLADALHCDWRALDVLALDRASLARTLKELRADSVVNCVGPFQGQDASYTVAKAAIDARAHYVDLADDRDFVCGVRAALDAEARAAGVAVVSGASSVPALAACVIDEVVARHEVAVVDKLSYAISPGNNAPRGLSTVGSVLSYAGHPFQRWQDGSWQTVYGWQDLRAQAFPGIPLSRLVASCNTPDLELFVERYGSPRTVEFHAGLELKVLQLGISAMAALTRLNLFTKWEKLARPLAAVSKLLLPFGTIDGAMSVRVEGKTAAQEPVAHTWSLHAHDDGPEIPSTPAVILVQKLARGELNFTGAAPCMGFFTYAEMKAALEHFGIDLIDNGIGTPGCVDPADSVAPLRSSLGDAEAHLPDELRAFHDGRGGTARGPITSVETSSPAGRMLARWLLGPQWSGGCFNLHLSSNGNKLTYRIVSADGSYTHSLTSQWSSRNGVQVETLGPLAVGSHSRPTPGGFERSSKALWLCGVYIPRCLWAPTITASATVDDTVLHTFKLGPLTLRASLCYT